MAKSGPTIPIYIDIDSSAQQAIAKWEKYNKEFQRISSKYSSKAEAAGMTQSDYTPMFRQLAVMKTEMKNAGTSVDELKAKAQALQASMNAVAPGSAKWDSYNTQLQKVNAQLAKFKELSNLNTAISSSGTSIDALRTKLQSLTALLNSSSHPNNAAWNADNRDAAGLKDKIAYIQKLGDYDVAMNNAGKTAQDLQARIQALNNVIAATDPKSSAFSLYNQQLQATKAALSDLTNLTAYENSMSKAAVTSEALQMRIQALNAMIKTTKPNSPEWTKYVQELEAAKRAMADNQSAQNYAAVMSGVSGSVAEARNKVQALQSIVNNLNPKTAEWKAYNAELQKAQAALGETERISAYNSAMSMVGNTMNQIRAKIQQLSTALANTRIFSPEWTALNKEIQSLNRCLGEQDRWGKYSSAMSVAANTAARLQQRIQAITGMLNNEKPNTKEWQKYNTELARAQQALSYRNKLDAYRTAMANSGRTVDQLRARIQALNSIINATVPKTGPWKKYRQELAAAEKQLASLEGSAKRTGDNTKEINKITEAYKSQRTMLSSVLTRMAIYWGVSAAGNMLRSIRDVSAEFEKQRIALGALIQNTAGAEVLFERIKKAAVESPFQIKDLTKYTKQLSAYQIETDQLFDTMMRLADLSSGLGVDMNRLILAYGQVKAASVLRGQEMRQFTEAGIPLVQALADKFTELRGEVTSTADVFALVSKRAVSFEMVQEVIKDMTDVGGRFYKMQEQQALTLAGRWENLKDSITIMYDEIGKSETVRKGLDLFINTTKSLAANWRTVGAVMGGVTTALIALKIASVNSTIATKAQNVVEARRAVIAARQQVRIGGLTRAILGKTAVSKLENAATKAAMRAQVGLASSTNLLTTAYWRLYAAIAANPVGMILVGVTALIGTVLGLAGAFSKVKSSAEEALEMATLLQETVDSFIETKNEDKKMIDIYTQLFNIKRRSMEQDTKMQAVAREMVDRYGDEIIDTYDKETGAIYINIAAVKELMAAEEKRQEVVANDTVLATEKKLAEERRKMTKAWELYDNMKKNPLRYEQNDEGMVYKTGFSEKDINKARANYNELKKSVEQLQNELTNARAKLVTTVELDPDALHSWRKKLGEYKTVMDGLSKSAFFDSEIKGFDALKDALEETYKRYKDYKEKTVALDKAIAVERNLMLKTSYESELKDTKAVMDMYAQILTDFNAWDWLNSKKSRSTKAPEDEYITMINSQAEFFKKYKRNVADLNKFISENKAIEQVSSLMAGEAAELGVDMTGLDGKTDTYVKKMEGLIEEVREKITSKFSEARGKNSLVELFSIKTKNTELVKYINLLKSLWSKFTDETLKDTQDKMKKSFDEYAGYVKSARTAKSFYDKIFEITGNADLSGRVAETLFGEDGKGLEEAIENQLKQAFSGVDLSNATDRTKLREELNKYLTDKKITGDLKPVVTELIDKKAWDELRLFLSALPEDAAKTAEQILDNERQSEADWLSGILKTYEKAKTYEERRTDIVNKAEKDRAAIREKAAKAGLSEKETQDLLTAVDNKEQSQLAALDLEILKSTDDWEKAFGDIERLGKHTITGLIALIDELIEKYKEAGADGENALSTEALKTLTEAREKLVGEDEQRNPIKTIVSGIKNYTKATAKVHEYRKALKEAKEDTDEYNDALAKLKEAENKQRKGLDQIKDGTTELSASFDTLSTFVSSVQDLFTELGMDESSDLAAGFTGVAKAFTLVGAALLVIKAACDLLLMNPLILGGAAIAAGLIAIVTTISSIKTNQSRREIKRLQRTIEDLEEAYERLDSAIEKAFGEDYIYDYNAQIANMKQRVEAYYAQAAKERDNGKKSDTDAIREYERQARDLEAEIEEMESQLSEKFSGTDLTSAASDFADAWIEAYKEFSSTTDAMSEKFEDMVQSMVTQSLAAKIMQNLLQPIFDAIDEASQSGGTLTAAEIAGISEMAKNTVPEINSAMLNLMNQLAAAGLNVRQTATSLTGISKDVSTASEESILGLAAGINTQNFYIAQTNSYVYQILQILSNGGSSAVSSAAASAVGDNYLAMLPTIADHTAGILERCEALTRHCESIATNIGRVVQPKSSTGSYWVVTN
jgi:tape measure domain-containing protein